MTASLSYSVDMEMVTLRGPSTKSFLKSLPRLNAQLEEFGIDKAGRDV